MQTKCTRRTGNRGISYRRFFQPKLTVNQPGDAYEQEADAVADRVMSMSNAQPASAAFFQPAIAGVQRAGTPREEGEKIQLKCAKCEEEEKDVQRKADEGATATKPGTGYINSLNSGRPLSKGERSFFEPRMGHDFSGVRIHTGEEADRSAKSLNALAYTTGNHIVFAKGQYQPESDYGKRLLAHELTHVIQQSAGQGSDVQRLHPAVVVSAAVLAAVACAYPFYSYALDNYLHKGDKWMHCWVSCKIGFYCGGPGIGTAVSVLIGAGKEVLDAAADQLGYNMHSEFADFVADLEGAFCNPFSTCVSCCDSAYPGP